MSLECERSSEAFAVVRRDFSSFPSLTPPPPRSLTEGGRGVVTVTWNPRKIIQRE